MPFTGKIGTDWTGEYSRWNFDETKAYQMVAKMQLEPGTLSGIPLLDAELNENSEIQLQLLRRAIKRIYGNGTTGNGFRIIQSSTDINNNFVITGGDGTPAGAGAIFIEGWQAINLSDVEYTDQDYGPVALTTPSGADRTDEVYLDVYYKEVTRADDGDIVDPVVALETSRRIALVWEVKVAEGTTTPVDYVDANNVQHWTLKLAALNRLNGDATITTAMIVDARNAERVVSLASELATHAALSNPHNATSLATADRLILRDSVGRAQIAAPAVDADIARLADVRAVIPSGSAALWVQTSAPTGWTKQTTHNDKALRVVSGAAGSGGSLAFSSAMASGRASGNTTAAGTVGNTTLTTTHMPAHYHDLAANATSASALTTSNYLAFYGNVYGGERNYYFAGTSTVPTLGRSETVGGGAAHGHTFTGSAHNHTLDMSVQYVDVIIATKN